MSDHMRGQRFKTCKRCGEKMAYSHVVVYKWSHRDYAVMPQATRILPKKSNRFFRMHEDFCRSREIEQMYGTLRPLYRWRHAQPIQEGEIAHE